MYTTKNFRTKKELKAAVEEYNLYQELKMAMDAITDVLVNRYGLENEPLTKQELRDIVDSINCIAQNFVDNNS
jgi:ABC-type phosphate transport system substrate-binding protein